ncbi:protein phosphatase 2C domain-containing protein [Besnoitia besnoiti]|uniref:Protein phosphatase 2C domain-containing protein n=1 Tax=Besnoitia besnoiti TaxID=94643 RepID=A0A2A9M7F9_BESBE|nr:protein phosphatase 2C domain-containing protein [Besnoitia besnoiti]PFH31330.1 protein phosphatase 2C domain-containing protein [Besnoitia besnoiti]
MPMSLCCPLVVSSAATIVIIEKVTTPRKVETRGRQIVEGQEPEVLIQHYRGQNPQLEEKVLGSPDAPFLLHVVNIGDSRAVLATPDEYYEMTKDHSPNDDNERKRIEEAGSTVTSVRGVFRIDGVITLSRALGDFDFKQPSANGATAMVSIPDIRYFYATYNDVIVLFCDGVTEPATVDWSTVAQTARTVLSQTRDVVQTATSVAHLAYNEGSEDNISVIVTQLLPQPQDAAAKLLAQAWQGETPKTLLEEDCSNRLETEKNNFFLPLF